MRSGIGAPGEENMTTFGIDLGTTNSSIAYIDDAGRPVIVRNTLGETATPSVVYFEGPDKITVGQAAKDIAVLAPHLVAQLIKRQMGRQGQYFTYHKQRYTPEMISAFILRDLARSAEAALNEPVRDVVITIPAYFGIAEREATRRAGEIAGLNVLDVLPEPVAAALSYQDRQAADDVRHVLVFDMGGGTFDTTVIRIGGHETTVICTDGDKLLGGADWDQRIEQYLLKEFTKQCPQLDPSADEQFRQELSVTAASMKHDLSSRSTRRCNIRFAGSVAQVELSRERLDELTSDLLERALAITRRTIEEAHRKGVADLGEVILVGGMTRTPAVAARLKDGFGLEVRRHEPDLAVARGAALFARTTQARRTSALGAGTGRPSGAAVAEDVAGTHAMGTDQDDEMMSARVATVMPRGLGVKVADENDPLLRTNPLKARFYVVHLLPANTPLPISVGPVQLATGADNQPGVDIEVWEQKGAVDSEELADNVYVGRGRLRSLVGLPAGSPIELTLSMNETGLLTVRAVEPGSGREVRFDLQIGGMDQAAVDEARTAVARHELSP
jgi:molecular chaperone DnaK (HSP70)